MAAHDTYPITGVPLKKPPPPNGAVPLRKNVNDWYRSKDEQDVIQVKLFLLALIKFEGLDVNDKLSFFQVAGMLVFPEHDQLSMLGPTSIHIMQVLIEANIKNRNSWLSRCGLGRRTQETNVSRG